MPWFTPTGSCNVLVHDYLEIGLEVVWTVVEPDLPQLVHKRLRVSEQWACRPL